MVSRQDFVLPQPPVVEEVVNHRWLRRSCNDRLETICRCWVA